MSPKQRGAGGTLKRTEVVTVRLDPMLRYGVELAARKHRRTASSFIEWAVEKALDQLVINEEYSHEDRVTIHDVLRRIWDTDEADRLVKLAIEFPELLNHDEQVLWKLIREYGDLWRGDWVTGGDQKEWGWEISEENFIFDRLREHWETFKGIAERTMDKTALPTFEKKLANPPIEFTPF